MCQGAPAEPHAPGLDPCLLLEGRKKRKSHEVKRVKKLLHITDPQRDTQPGLSLLPKPAEKKHPMLPPVYATVSEFERYQVFLEEDQTDSKLPTLPPIKKWFIQEDPIWVPKEQVPNHSFSHLHGSSAANPQVKLSAQTARVMERNARQALAFLHILDHFNSAVATSVQQIGSTTELSKAKELAQRAHALLVAAVPVTEGAVQ